MLRNPWDGKQAIWDRDAEERARKEEEEAERQHWEDEQRAQQDEAFRRERERKDQFDREHWILGSGGPLDPRGPWNRK